MKGTITPAQASALARSAALAMPAPLHRSVPLELGTIGRELFMITAGSVDVLGEDRGATVRAASPVDVLVMSREDFRSLVAQFPVLDEHFGNLMRLR